jgi:mitogen-activated protein kinase kinase
MNLKPKTPADGTGLGAGTGAGDSAVDGFIAVAPGPTSAPASGTSASAKRMTYHTTLSNTLANLDLNADVKYDLRDDDLKDLQELGQGNGGSVKKVEHVPSHTIMAKKVHPFHPHCLISTAHCPIPPIPSLICCADTHCAPGTDRSHRCEAVRS